MPQRSYLPSSPSGNELFRGYTNSFATPTTTLVIAVGRPFALIDLDLNLCIDDTEFENLEHAPGVPFFFFATFSVVESQRTNDTPFLPERTQNRDDKVHNRNEAEATNEQKGPIIFLHLYSFEGS